MNRYGSIIIDGKDGWGEYGFVILKGSVREWLTFPDMKEPFSHNWKDQSGIEVDLDNVYVKEKNVSLKILFVSDSQLGFWNNYKKLQTVLTSPGFRRIYYREMEKEFEVYYTKCTDVSTPTRLRDTNKIIVSMSLHFIMPDPTKIIEKLIPPTGINLTVNSNIVGYGSFSYSVTPYNASQGVRVLIIPGTGNAYVSGNLVYASQPGTVTLRVESVVDTKVYAQRTLSVFPDNIVQFENGIMLEFKSGEYITVN